MNVVDSSAWLEYFADGPNAADFATAIEHVDSLVVPTVAVNDVYKRILQQRNEAAATATAHHATLWTQDADFEGFDGV